MNNQAEFDEIFSLYYSQLYFFARQHVDDANECDDIVSSAYEDAWRHFANIERKSAKTWLFVNVKNKCLDWLRRQVLHRNYAELHAHLCSISTVDDDPVEFEERCRYVERVVEMLPRTTRTIFTRCYVDGKKYREVAEEMEISPETVKKHIVRALRLLKEAREKYKNN
ncbi:MAG: RNA polymerase sigma factor [Prevotella sp.]